MSDYLTQAAWAERFGVTTRTFLRWRRAGVIPAPDVMLPGVPRWSVKLVEQTMRRLKPVEPRGFGKKGVQFLKARAQRGANHAQLGQFTGRERSLHHAGVSQQAIRDVHARQSDESAAARHLNTVDEAVR